jgi:hypothetical protein
MFGDFVNLNLLSLYFHIETVSEQLYLTLPYSKDI